MISIFDPNTLGEELDTFTAKLITSINLENSPEVNSLKLDSKKKFKGTAIITL